MHAAHGIGHAVRGRAGGHVVRMQGTTRAAAGSDGEILPAGLEALLLIGTGDRVLEAGRVGGVAGDGNIRVLVPHDGHALANVVRAVAANLCALAAGIRGLTHDGQRMVFLHVGGEVIVLGLHIGEAVDAADNHGRILAQAVEDHAQRLGAHLVRVQRDLDRALGRREGLVTSEESEALGVFIQQHRAEVAVAEADLALIGDRAGDAERLQTLADALGGFGGGLNTFLHRDRRAQLVSPLHVLEADRLGALHDGIRIHALGVGVGLHFVKVLEAILVKHRLELRHTTFIVFKKSHCFARLLLICPSADQSTSQRRPPP